MTEENSTTNPSGSSAIDGDGDDAVLDYIQTPLNACSLETFCGLPAQDSKDSSLIPLCLGCYQLNESTGKREGRLDLYAVSSLDEKSSSSSSAGGCQTFGGSPLTILGGDGETATPPPGVLDGKWSNHPSWSGSGGGSSSGGFQNYYATAHANGEIWIHDICSKESMANNATTSTTSEQLFQAKLAGKSTSPSASEGLCLALAWEDPLYSTTSPSPNESEGGVGVLDTRIISSYSDGHTAIHRVRGRNDELELELEHHWDSHKIFTCPAEVWCANFIDANTVVTGGDEGRWKVWDLRQPLGFRPVHDGRDDFGAGVTVLAPHPRNPRLLAIGSYDETIAIFDLRKTTRSGSRPQELYHSESLGGGIWRCKWHPLDHHKLLVAAMHGGCVVGAFEGLDAASSVVSSSTALEELPAGDSVQEPVQFRIQKEFKLHQSMAYGIDWLASNNHSDRGVEAAAASCSFYDKAMYLWKTGSS